MGGVGCSGQVCSSVDSAAEQVGEHTGGIVGCLALAGSAGMIGGGTCRDGGGGAAHAASSSAGSSSSAGIVLSLPGGGAGNLLVR